MAGKSNAQAQMKEITERLEQGVKELFASDKYADYLKTMSRFHSYSTRNTLLIHLQKPDATAVAGFNAWKNQWGRTVKKGEKGIRILAPTPFTVKKDMQVIDPNTQRPVMGADGLPVTEEVEVKIPRFKPVAVFDVSQTEGKPLPSLAEDIGGNVEHYELLMDAIRHVSPLPIGFEPMKPEQDGVCRFGKEIAIREGMSEVQTVGAAFHEVAHAVLHDTTIQKDTPDEPVKRKDERTEEVEAESISYTVCQYFGIETSPNSFGYLAAWSKGKELKELNASLDVIRRTSATLIDGVEKRYRELAKERGIELVGAEPAQEAEPQAEAPAAPAMPTRADAEAYAAAYLEFMNEVVNGDFLEGMQEGEGAFVQRVADNLLAGKVDEIENNLHLAREVDEDGATGPDPGDMLGRLGPFKAIPELQKQSREQAEQAVQAAFDRLTCGDEVYLDEAKKPVVVVTIRDEDVVFSVPELGLDLTRSHDDVIRSLQSHEGNRHLLDAAKPVPEQPPKATEPELQPNQHIEEIDGVEFVVTTVTPQVVENSRQPEPPAPEKQYDLGFGHLGNGLTVWNRLEEQNGDYVTVAHIDPERQITYRDPDLPDSIKERIAEVARTSDMTVSATQDTPVFSTPPQPKPSPAAQQEPPAVPDAPAASGPIQDADRFLEDIGGVGNLFGEPTAPPAPEPAPAQPDEIMPDPAIGFSERDLFGYSAPDMLPLTQARALELFAQDQVVYLLYPDNTEQMAFDRAEIEAHEGIFGVDAAEWRESTDFEKLVQAGGEAARESDFLNSEGDRFAIYQLKHGDDLHYHRFAPMEQLEQDGLSVNRGNYELMYSAPLPEGETLDGIFERFNIDRPEDFKGHSLSVSDVVVLNQGGEITSHYCDSTSFAPLPTFLGMEKQPEPTYSQNGNTLDAAHDGPTVAELEQAVNEGKTISLLDLANAVKNERQQPAPKQKPSILAQLQNTKKAAAQAAEQQKDAPKRDSGREV